jgi:hypothetical protein
MLFYYVFFISDNYAAMENQIFPHLQAHPSAKILNLAHFFAINAETGSPSTPNLSSKSQELADTVFVQNVDLRKSQA